MGWEIADVLAAADAVVAVDFHQPGANNVLPVDHVPNVILDHHAVGDLPAADVAIVHPEFSATSSLVASLMTALDAEMDAVLATALAFGIRTDTLGFTRGVSPSDLRALSWLNAWVDHDLLRQIEAPPRSRDALAAFAEALASMELEGGVLLAPLLHLPNRDALAQVADFLLATEGVDTVVVYGPRQGRVILSARTRNSDLHLGRTLAGRFPEGQAGGHRSLAGGQVRFSGLVEHDAAEPEEAIAAMTLVLRDLLGGEGDE
jgi:nanoRNase/pAp phosphatase (c-di-AMP/oligoRNAs hydrolase)